uniref:B30.2/SPRY domain-containing protein n=1 Tax=Oncorhynchus tshawytscha TaxID=74940 RepID=A0AAZ3SHC9_ONCTS
MIIKAMIQCQLQRRGPRNSQLGMSQQKLQQRIQEREKELKELQQAVESLKHSAQAAVEDSDRIFTELIHSIERRCSEVNELIRDQEKAQVSQADGLLEQLEQEIAELRRRNAELEQLSHTEDHIHFLQSYQSISSPSVSSDLPSIVIHPQYFVDVNKTVSDVRERLEGILKGEWTKISTTVNSVDILLSPEPKNREHFLQYSCQLTLDPNTAQKSLSLSEGNRKVTVVKAVNDPNPDHPDRFTDWWQVLCREGLSGRCYWEVEGHQGTVFTAVSYKDISRIRMVNDSRFGYNDKSWGLECSSNGYRFRHNNIETKVSGPQSSRVGVYLDHKAGTLSFYSISDTMTLLHTVKTTFTKPLYPGIWVGYKNDSAVLCKL